MKIFSYGSNMLSTRIKKRINNYKVIDIGYLEKHSLRFHKKSKDGSGKADAWFTKKKNNKVWGVLGEIDEKSKEKLDKIEGVGNGYNQKKVKVITKKGIVKAIIYVADKDYIKSNLLPYDWYKEFVLRGSIENSFPEKYIEFIRKTPCKKDSDRERRAKNLKIIEDAGTEQGT